MKKFPGVDDATLEEIADEVRKFDASIEPAARQERSVHKIALYAEEIRDAIRQIARDHRSVADAVDIAAAAVELDTAVRLFGAEWAANTVQALAFKARFDVVPADAAFAE